MLRFRVLGASCFGLRFRVLRFRNYPKREPSVAGTKTCPEIHLGHHQHVAPCAFLRNREEYDLASDKTS